MFEERGDRCSERGGMEKKRVVQEKERRERERGWEYGTRPGGSVGSPGS